MSTQTSLHLPPLQHVDVDGPVRYREWPGPEDRPTFVCVHGFGGSGLNWALVAPLLAAAGRVLALDLPGFGETPLAGREADVAGSTRAVAGFMKALDLPPAVLLGSSLGGKVALTQAAASPATVRSLVLVGAAFPRGGLRAPQTSPRVAAGIAAMSAGGGLGAWVSRSRARRRGAERVVRDTLRLCAVQPWTIDAGLVGAMVDLTERRQMNPDAGRALAQAARSLSRDHASPDAYRRLVRSVTQPTLVVHGWHDRLVPVAFARRAVREHSNWHLLVYPDLGHIPMIEAPNRFADSVLAWLGRTIETDSVTP